MVDKETPSSNPLDSELNKANENIDVVNENYTNDSDSGEPVARAPMPGGDENKAKRSSWTMQEIDRVVAKSVVSSPKQKLDDFAFASARQNNLLKFRNTNRVLSGQLSKQFSGELQRGSTPQRLRSFDIYSQTTRLVTANATMGIYQFHKKSVLPHMQKSISLTYKQISVLKEISLGIKNVHQVLNTKLEAIKINTAAAVPKPKTYLNKLWTDVQDMNRQRVAGNISKLLLDRQDAWYRKIISPITKTINDQMQDPTEKGGVNGLRRVTTGKLNSLRRKARDIGKEDPTGQGSLGRLRIGGAKLLGRALKPVVKGTQRVRLGVDKNRSIGNFLSDYTDDAARFNPFSSGWDTRFKDAGGDETATGDFAKLTNSFAQWRMEYRKDQDRSIAALLSIRDKIGGSKVARKYLPKDQGGTIESPPAGTPISQNKSSIFGKIKSINFRRKVKATNTSEEDILSPITQSDKSRSTDEAVGDIKTPSSVFGKVTASPFVGGMIKSATEMAEKKPQEQAKQAFSDHVNAFKLHMSTKNLQNQGDLDRKSIGKMFERLGERVDGVKTSVSEGNKQRSMFERVQLKWKELSDKLNKKPRKNSYEDMQARKGLLSGKDKSVKDGTVKRVVGSASAALASGDLFGAANELIGDLKDQVVDSATDAITDKVEEKGSRAARKAKIFAKSRGRRISRSVSRGIVNRREASGKKSLVRRLLNSRDSRTRVSPWAPPAAKKGVVRTVGGFVGRTAMKTVGGAATLGWGATKLAGGLGLKGSKIAGGALVRKGLPALGRGGLSLAKGLGPGLAVGLAADVGQNWINKNTTGATNRLGNTAAEAAKWGATGATIGSIFPVVGTAWGAGVGAAVGALIANFDLISKGVGYATSKVFDGFELLGKAGSFAWKNLFGSDPKIDRMGRVKEQGTQNLMGNVFSGFFGRDAKYSKSGEVAVPGRTGLLSNLNKGFHLFFFGVKDPKDMSKYQDGSSMLGKVMGPIIEGLSSVTTTFQNIPNIIADHIRSVLSGGNIFGGTPSNPDTSGLPGTSGKAGEPVKDASVILKALIPEARMTSHRRAAGQAGNAGNKSWHVKSGAAIDVAPVPGMTYQQFVARFRNAGYKIIEDIDETSPAAMKKTGATGPHWHIVLGERPTPAGGSSDYSMTNTPNPQTSGNGSMLMTGGGGNKYAGTSWDGKPTATGSAPYTQPSQQTYATGLGKSPQVAAGGKAAFGTAVNYLMSKKGYSRNAALGIATNLYAESNMKTDAFNKAGGGKGAHGIAQWRADRITDIEGKWGKPIRQMNLYEQLDAVDMEIREGKHITNARIQNGSAPFGQALNNSPTVEAAIQQFVHRFERPGNPEGATRARIQLAQGLIGGVGQSPAKAEEKVAQSTAPKPSTPKPAPVKQAAPKAVKPEPTKKAVPKTDSSSFGADIVSAINDLKSAVIGSDKKANNSKTIIAPTINQNKGAWPTGVTTMSMSKTTVRTGA